VSKSGYYQWLGRRKNRPKDYEDYLLVKQIFEKGKKKLGWRSIQMRLKNGRNTAMNHKKIRRIMNHYGLYCKIRRKNPYKAIMKKAQEHHIAPNLLGRQFTVRTARRVLCTDITYLYFALGRIAYLSVIKDIATGEILAWRLSLNLELEFVIQTVKQLKEIRLADSCLLHSDQGFHYTSFAYRQALQELDITQSMSRKGNCIDNAPMESFFGHCKDELEFKACRTFEELIVKVGEYMQYYNHDRYQWDLNKMTPVQFRDHLVATNAA
jgi:transposase InsO family protein